MPLYSFENLEQQIIDCERRLVEVGMQITALDASLTSASITQSEFNIAAKPLWQLWDTYNAQLVELKHMRNTTSFRAAFYELCRSKDIVLLSYDKEVAYKFIKGNLHTRGIDWPDKWTLLEASDWSIRGDDRFHVVLDGEKEWYGKKG